MLILLHVEELLIEQTEVLSKLILVELVCMSEMKGATRASVFELQEEDHVIECLVV